LFVDIHWPPSASSPLPSHDQGRILQVKSTGLRLSCGHVSFALQPFWLCQSGQSYSCNVTVKLCLPYWYQTWFHALALKVEVV
jgi:hypothetical protein